MTENENDANNKISLSIEEENILNDAKLFIQEEYNIKTEKLKLLKQELSQTKKQFQSQIQEYQKEIKLTIEKENDIQLLYSKISKKKKRRAIIIKNSFNNKFYTHLLEISSNLKKEKILNNYFSLIMFENQKKNIKELLEILKNEEEIKNLLYYSYKIYYDLNQKDINLYNNLKQKFENYLCETKDLEGGGYPFDEMFESLGIIFEIIEIEKNIKENNSILNKLIEKKNAKFVEIKNIENRIKNYYKNIKKIKSHLKIIHSFYDNFKENSSNNAYSLKELIDKIEEYKKIDFDFNKTNPNFDAITSFTFGTYCTQSEDSSMKSSNLNSKKKLVNNKLLKSNNNTVPKFNINESKGDKEEKGEIFKNNKNGKFNANIKENKNNKINLSSGNNSNGKKDSKIKSNIFINENREIKKEINNVSGKNCKTNNINFIEIKDNKIYNKQNKINLDKIQNKDLNSNNKNKSLNGDKEEVKNDINQTNESNKQKDEKGIIKEDKIEEEKEILDKKKILTNFTNLNLLGSEIDQLKHREPDESIEMTMPKEKTNKIYNINNNEYNFNDSSVCDEMISFNYENGNNMGRSTTNDYINKIGVKNNVVLSQELYKNKLFMRRNGNEFGKLKIEKSIEASTCCVSCT